MNKQPTTTPDAEFAVPFDKEMTKGTPHPGQTYHDDANNQEQTKPTPQETQEKDASPGKDI